MHGSGAAGRQLGGAEQFAAERSSLSCLMLPAWC